MLDTLIHLLQEESERVCGTALPTEICRIILIRWRGMQHPTARIVSPMDGTIHPLRYQAQAAWEQWAYERDYTYRYYGIGMVYKCVPDAYPLFHIAFDHRYWMPLWVLDELGHKIEEPVFEQYNLLRCCGFGGCL